MMNFNYSIIIPFRDNIDLLQTAVNSIPDRTDIQIIIVDNSKESLESFFVNNHKNACLKYLTSSATKGAGHARNVGLEQAEGKWLLFLDADDYFTKSAFEYFDEYLNTEFDLVCFNITSCMLETGARSNRHVPYGIKLQQYFSTNNDIVIRYLFPTPYCKMIRHVIVSQNNVKFDEIKVSNDLMFSMRCGLHANSVSADNRTAYCVTEAEKDRSLTKQHNPENWEIRYLVAIEKYKFLKKIGHIEAAPSLYGYLVIALKDFGIRTFIRFLKLGLKENVNFLIKFTNRKWIKDH